VEEPVHEQDQASTTGPDSTYATKGTLVRLGYYGKRFGRWPSFAKASAEYWRGPAMAALTFSKHPETNRTLAEVLLTTGFVIVAAGHMIKLSP
jgi:hypothetical protein